MNLGAMEYWSIVVLVFNGHHTTTSSIQYSSVIFYG
jgi:hypothetical protein